MRERCARWRRLQANAFLRRVREDFAAVERGNEHTCACSFCWHEAFSAGRALQAVAASGMSEDELALAVWHWMHSEGPWEWKHRERLRSRLGDDEK